MKPWIKRIDFYTQLAGFILPIVKIIKLNTIQHFLRVDVRYILMYYQFMILPVICCIQLLSILLNLFFLKRHDISIFRLVISILYILYLPLVFLAYYFEWNLILNFLISFLPILSGIMILIYFYITYVDFIRLKRLVNRKYFLESI